MVDQSTVHVDSLKALSASFVEDYPVKSARFLESVSGEAAAEFLEGQSLKSAARLWRYLSPGLAELIFQALSEEFSQSLLLELDAHEAVALLGRMDWDDREACLALLEKTHESYHQELSDLLKYPEASAARLMVGGLLCFDEHARVGEVLNKIRRELNSDSALIFLQDAKGMLAGELSVSQLLRASDDAQLSDIAGPNRSVLQALDEREQVIDKFEAYRCSAMPVVDAHGQLIGQVRYFDVFESAKQELVSDIQQMVGASKDEQALSSSWFAVRKRLPWLQINLLTAFAAAAVVGAFEGLISQVTALAILLPVAAGQSGNAGAQALAVTMRGLTLREITTQHWRRVVIKELSTGFLNGIAIALTCALGVYIWSGSVGLSLVIGFAMVSSLVIACGAGALVPIVLKRFGMDPAQSSSIVLTTITDIAGFMSFLGIALLLSDMLPKG